MTKKNFPGALVLVVGPSGAGKDSLLRAAAQRFAGNPAYVFPRRVVTRTADSNAEDHVSVSDMAFSIAVAKNEFALWWGAHGNAYGIPMSIEDDLEEGRLVAVNCSRASIADAIESYGNVAVIEITAPTEVLISRIMARGRESHAEAELRVSRKVEPLPKNVPIVRIENVGPIENAASAFCDALADLVKPLQNLKQNVRTTSNHLERLA